MSFRIAASNTTGLFLIADETGLKLIPSVDQVGLGCHRCPRLPARAMDK